MEGGEFHVVDSVPLADVDEVVACLGEEQVTASGRTDVTDAVAAVEEGSSGALGRG